MNEWHNKKLEEIGKIFSGSTPSTNKQQYWNGDIVWITPDDLSKLRTPYMFTSERKITKAGLNSSSLALLPPGSIVISSRAPIGYLAIPKVEFCTNQGCKSIDLKTQIDSEFAYYNILFNLAKFKNLGEGTTFAEISKTALSKVKLPFPDNKEEQTYIAVVLSMIDKAIAQTETTIEKQTRIKTGLMQDLLTKGIDENGNIRSEKTRKFKDSPLGRIPVEWEINNMAGACSLIQDGTHLPPKRVENGPLLLGVQNIIDGTLVETSSDTRVSWDFFNAMHSKWAIEASDVLLAIVGATIGKVTQVPLGFPSFTIQRSVCVLRGKVGYLDNTFLRLLISDSKFQNQIWNAVNRTAQPGMYLMQLSDCVVQIPKFIEQLKIVEILWKIESLIDTEKQNKMKLCEIKLGLMQDLLPGKVPVTELLKEKEPV